MKYLSICSGIEACSVAWESLGWEAVGFSEIEPFPRTVLAHHYPSVPLYGDFTQIKYNPPDADLLVGGVPCQAFSIAGLRNSLADVRGNLTLEYVKLANSMDDYRRTLDKQPIVTVWENVLGVLSVKDNAFGCLLSGLAGEDVPLVPPRGKWTHSGCVFGPQRRVAWRVLDAQHFGVPQRRRRIFVVSSAREDFDPIQVFHESQGLPRDTKQSRKERPKSSSPAQERFALGGDLACCVTAGEGRRNDLETCAFVFDETQCTYPGHRRNHQVTDPSHTLTASGRPPTVVSFHPTQTPIFSHDLTHALSCGSSGGSSTVGVYYPPIIRKITPIEAERLQGFPDNWTQVPYEGKPSKDGPRYKAIGNSMAVPVMNWIGQRIQKELDRTSAPDFKKSPQVSLF